MTRFDQAKLTNAYGANKVFTGNAGHAICLRSMVSGIEQQERLLYGDHKQQWLKGNREKNSFPGIFITVKLTFDCGNYHHFTVSFFKSGSMNMPGVRAMYGLTAKQVANRLFQRAKEIARDYVLQSPQEEDSFALSGMTLAPGQHLPPNILTCLRSVQ
jgi:hypothetical protein